jgi:hypothetical protein
VIRELSECLFELFALATWCVFMLVAGVVVFSILGG